MVQVSLKNAFTSTKYIQILQLQMHDLYGMDWTSDLPLTSMAGAAIVTFGAPEAAEAAMKLDRSIIAGNSRFIAPWIYMRSRDLHPVGCWCPTRF